MELRNKEAKVIIISGKARSGKDTTAGYMKKYYESNGQRVVILQYSSYIKDYAKKITNWDGRDETKPRDFLQELGTEIIRNKIDGEFFIKRIVGDIKVYSYFFDVVIISDARARKEIDIPKSIFKDVVSINIERPNFDNGLSNLESNHFTETDLDNYNDYDYVLVNNGTLEDLEMKTINLVSEI